MDTYLWIMLDIFSHLNDRVDELICLF